MNYQYVGYNEGGETVRGNLSDSSEKAATDMLAYAGYQVLQLKPFSPFFSMDKLTSRVARVNRPEIILFYRQLALLLESGINIATALELLQSQTGNRALKNVLGEVVADLRSGSQLSASLGKYPEIFSTLCQRSLHVGEQTGNMETILRQVADYLEKESETSKSIKNALRVPAITAAVAVVVVTVLTIYVLPEFSKLYRSLGAQLPAITTLMITLTEKLHDYGAYGILALGGAILTAYIYARTEEGKYRLDSVLLRLPMLGRILHLGELARCCRTISLLYTAGLSLTEITPLLIQGTSNTVVSHALSEVQSDMLRGEGLSLPMSKISFFLPMMVQMVKVGEETGNLDSTMLSVAQTYETEVDDRTKALINTIQPAMTIAIGLVVGFIALSLTSAMYSIYGQSGV